VKDPGENGATLPESAEERTIRQEMEAIRSDIDARADLIRLQQRRQVALKQAVKTVRLAPGTAMDERELGRAVLAVARLYESWIRDGANPE
jgi:hypothetical protein